ncbi:MAG TPA: sulfite exporter TauE/SafE family protein [Stellaceae bacterium]|nr:sulfite exporter TauE/SafE family protein [Stellaceae bacterium]
MTTLMAVANAQASGRLKQSMPFITIVVASVVICGYILAYAKVDSIGVVAMLAILISALISSIAGFAFSALAGAILFHLMEPVHAVAIMIGCSIAIQSYSIAALRGSIEWRKLMPFLVGGVAGVPVGVFVLHAASPKLYGVAIGVLLIAYGGYMLLRKPMAPMLRGGKAADAVVGFLGGITGGLAAFPGAFVTIWCGLRGWDKVQQRGVFQPYILAMQVYALIYLVVAGGRAGTIDFAFVTYLPAALIGAFIGLKLFRRMTDEQFNRAVFLLLIVSGFGLAL